MLVREPLEGIETVGQGVIERLVGVAARERGLVADGDHLRLPRAP